MARSDKNDDTREALGNTPEGAQGADGTRDTSTVSTGDGEVRLEPIGAQEQTRVNAAPTAETTAGRPNPVETVGQPLVYANGDAVEVVTDRADDAQVTLTSPDGSVVTVREDRARTLRARGYVDGDQHRGVPVADRG